MQKRDFLLLLDDLIEREPGTLTGAERLADLEGWDSLTVIGFMALVDEQFGLTVPANRIAQAKTVDDLISLVGDRVDTR